MSISTLRAWLQQRGSDPMAGVEQAIATALLPFCTAATFATTLATTTLATTALLLGTETAAQSAETLMFKLGPIQQSASVDDLDSFAKTGQIPPALTVYSPVLTPQVQLALTSHLPFDASASDDLIADLLQSSTGEKIFEALALLIPDSNPEKIETALRIASQHPNGLSILGVISAYPDPTLTLDASAAVTLASQLNLPHWQRGMLNAVLERELTEPGTLDSVPFDPSQPGHARVYRTSLNLEDSDRDREIPVDLYWNEWSQGPLVVISHGFAADRRFLRYLAEHLSSHGLTVAAIEHPTSNVTWINGIALGIEGGSRFSDILPTTEFLDRPQDVRFLLDWLEQHGHRHAATATQSPGSSHSDSDQPSNPFNTQDVTIIGHSLGGYTALALAGAPLDLEGLRQFCGAHSVMELAPADWLQCRAVDLPDDQVNFRDARITQVIALNPVMARIFGPSSLAQITIPTLVTAASEDHVTPAVTQQLLPFTNFQMDTRYLLTAIGATHLSMGDPANLNPLLTKNMVLRERTWNETDHMRALLKGLSLAFIKQQTPEADLYAPFLNPLYVQSWSDDVIQLRLNSDLPQTLKHWLRLATPPIERAVSATLPKTKDPEPAQSAYTVALHWLSGSILLLLFMPPAGMSLRSLRQFNRQWNSKPPKPTRRKRDGAPPRR